MAKKHIEPSQIEIGDFVTMTDGPDAGFSGILDNVFIQDGVTMFAVIHENDPDTFWIVSAIKPFK